jgi:thiosulfate dehydrogenase [quinone] large subunit
MATTHHPIRERRTHQVDIAKDLTPEATAEPRVHSRAVRITAAVTRISIGWVFLWAFLDKTFGLGFATPAERAWLEGGSPTSGFLGGVDGTFAGFFNSMAGHAWADWLFMIGLAGIGLALVLGVATWISTVSGAALLVLMWMAELPLENNPFMDDHLVYGAVLVLLALLGAGRYYGLGAYWERLPFVKRAAILR